MFVTMIGQKLAFMMKQEEIATVAALNIVKLTRVHFNQKNQVFYNFMAN